MTKILYESETVLLNYDKTNRLIEMLWKKKTNSSEYRLMLNTLIEFSKKRKIDYFISDMRKEGLVHTDDVKWLEKEVLVRAIKQGIKRIALISDDSLFTNIYAETIKKKLENSSIDIQIFRDYPEAKAWIFSVKSR